jgi:hypothetical protein
MANPSQFGRPRILPIIWPFTRDFNLNEWMSLLIHTYNNISCVRCSKMIAKKLSCVPDSESSPILETGSVLTCCFTLLSRRKVEGRSLLEIDIEMRKSIFFSFIYIYIYIWGCYRRCFWGPYIYMVDSTPPPMEALSKNFCNIFRTYRFLESQY